LDRIAPKPSLVSERRRLRHVLPAQLTDRLTPLGRIFETSSMGVPDIRADDWKLDITGLVDSPTSMWLKELKRLPKRTVETVFVCSGNPVKPTVPLRRAANVRWGGVDLADLLDLVGVRPEASHIWSYGLDYGNFFGVSQPHYVKDMPLSRLTDGNVLIAYEMNDEPLTQVNGFPARLVIPGYYGTNCVKWLCRIALMARRPSEFQTIKMYSDPDVDAEGSERTSRPVWAVAPESIIVSPGPTSTIARAGTEIWGWAWSDCPVQFVEISVDGGRSWMETMLEAAIGLSWQRFSHPWSPARSGSFQLLCRATDASGKTQPIDGARNAVHSIDLGVED
jgi:DMSO/TMAO reductase YedYZ molybdopterin-dependent catalytic subunit